MPLSGYRVLEFGSGVALSYCGKLFADFGADVVKLEPRGGDPLRSMPPVLANGESGVAAWLNTNKRSVLDIALPVLLAGADLLLDGRTPAEIGTSHDEWRAAHPGLSIIAISWFGMPRMPVKSPSFIALRSCRNMLSSVRFFDQSSFRSRPICARISPRAA